MEIHVLHRQGHSIRAIARSLGVSRNTVRHYLRQPAKVPIYTERQPKPSILDSFKPYLLDRIEAARSYWMPGTVLHREIQGLGYQGGLLTIKVFIGEFKPSQSDPVVRFETGPGVQLQVDFTTIRRGRDSLKAFVATLGYSRASYVRFSKTERQEDWIEGIQGALEYFGGVPKELLFDNAKCIMIQRNAYGEGEHQWNPALLDQAKIYGYALKACRPYRAKTKGKVERFNSYLKQSFVTPLLATLKQAELDLTVEAANAHVGPWLIDIAHQRDHGTTRIKPQIRLDEERLVFQALPPKKSSEAVLTIESRMPPPIESFQHPLAVYDQLLEVC